MIAPFVLHVEAQSGAPLLAKLIGLLAQRDIDILALDLRRWRQGVSEIRFKLMCPAPHDVEILAARLEQVIGVSAVRVEQSAIAA